MERFIVETSCVRQPSHLVLREASLLQEREYLFQTCRHRESPAKEHLPDEELEHGSFSAIVVQVNFKHIELVEIRQQQAGVEVHMR